MNPSLQPLWALLYARSLEGMEALVMRLGIGDKLCGETDVEAKKIACVLELM